MKDENKIKTELYSKMEKEFEKFLRIIDKSSVEKLVDSAYEITIKQELLCLFYPEYDYYNIKDLSLLNKEKEPLQLLYNDWLKFDGGIHEVLENSISLSLRTLEKNAKSNRMLEVR